MYLRVVSSGGTEGTSITVEPFAGNHLVAVSQARSVYRIEIGYYEPPGEWNSVATSDAIATPPDDVSENDSIDVATVPFHMSFQRMIDSFRAAHLDGEALVGMVSRLQETADTVDKADLTDVDLEVLSALDCTSSGTDAMQRSQLRKAENAFATRRKIEAVLGYGVSSRM